MTTGLTGVAALEAEMRDRLADKNAEITRLRSLLAAAEARNEIARKSLERFAGEVERCEHGHLLIDIAKAIRTQADFLRSQSSGGGNG